MKTKSKNFGNFFVRVGAGFLAFWLVTMGAFSLLLGQQRAQLMMADIEDYAGRFLGNYAKYMLDSKEQDTDDPVELRKMLKQSIFELNTPEAQIIETAITDQSGNVLQSNRWWLKLKDDADTEYETDMDGQPQNVYEAIIIGSGVTELGKPIPNMSFEAWVDGNQAYLKSVTVRPNKVVDGEWVPTGEVSTVECVYDADKMSGLPLKTLTMSRMALPGWSENWTAKQTAACMASPARKELRAWAENPSRAGGGESIVRPWLVRQYQRTMKYCDYADGGYVMMSFAAEGCPLKACLPILVPAGVLSLILAMLCAIILSCALLRVWRKQERIEQVRRETTAALAHELKTPLSVLSATAELLGDNLAPEKQGHYLEVIRQQAQRMDGSVRQMLELSRLETGAKALRRTVFSLAELAQERLQAALPTDSTIHTEFAAQGEYEVNADRALLTRALDALLENAVQHTPEGGCITVHLADGVLSVTNTGNAIPADALPRLWEAYYQADPSRSAKGDGLGLSIAKTVFDLHGYACGAENTEIGPKFWFRFADK
ncbi:sensor histidine kinase [Agathobaculum butyriciproducens]|uniref:sensor histidine kinase n=1 Tax=Agathobaculum butyriciproducens TaxID=1628085 RepID=UPI003AF13B2F